MELKRPKAIIFDWDNTLVNTWPVIHAALNKTLIDMAREPWPMEMVKQRVARSMRDSFPLVFGDDWQAAGELYQSNFRAIHLERLEALPGAEDTLKWLSDKPVHVAVASNKRGVNLRKESTHIGWDQYFQKLIGAEDTPHDKPAAAPVHAALLGSGVPSGSDVWFVGDSSIDMECAHNTGCVPVWYGELPEEPLAYNFAAHAKTHADLVKMLERLF